MGSFLLELFQFLRSHRKLWMLPVIGIMLVFGGLIVATQGTAVAPLLYTIF